MLSRPARLGALGAIVFGAVLALILAVPRSPAVAPGGTATGAVPPASAAGPTRPAATVGPVPEGPSPGSVPATTTTAAPPPSEVPPVAPPPDRDADRRALAAARQRWASRAPEHYRYYVQQGCFCALTDVLVEVRKGTIVSATLGGDPNRPTTGITVDALFGIAAQTIDQQAFYAIRFDPDYGYPTVVSSQGGSGGDQMTYLVSLFTVLT